MKKYGKTKDCSYLYDSYYDILYISLSFQDLTNIDKCNDYFMVACNDYLRKYKNKGKNSIIDLIREVKKGC